MKKLFCCKTAFALILAILIGVASAFAQPWKFGIISDTQWTTTDPANQNPIPYREHHQQINQQFININNSTHDLKFVIAMGDQVDTGSQANDYVRALYAQDLYNAGIGFYPCAVTTKQPTGLCNLRRGFPARLPADIWRFEQCHSIRHHHQLGLAGRRPGG